VPQVCEALITRGRRFIGYRQRPRA